MILDITKCKFYIKEDFTILKGKFNCSCAIEDRIPETEIAFLKDQRCARKKSISPSRDVTFTKTQIENSRKKPKILSATILSSTSTTEESSVYLKRLRDQPSDIEINTVLSWSSDSSHSDECYEPKKKIVFFSICQEIQVCYQ